MLKSGSQLRLPEPPGRRATRDEIQVLKELASQRDEAALAQIAYWNTGAPEYRWHEIAVNEMLKSNIGGHGAARI